MSMEQDGMTDTGASWFLSSEGGEPLGQVYRAAGQAEPSVGEVLEGGQRWKRAQVVSFQELRASCAMRRFQVVVRIIE